MVQVTPEELPKEWRVRLDLFEFGFVYLFLPLVVSTMDRSAIGLGGKILLWLVAWFFLRRQADLPRCSRSREVRWTTWLVPVALMAVAGGASVLFWGQSLATVGWLVAQCALVATPACALVFSYLPVRFADANWLPESVKVYLPALAFSGLHAASGTWQAPALALVAGGLACRIRIPLWAIVAGQVGIHWWGRGRYW